MNYTGYQSINPGSSPFTSVQQVLEMADHITDLTGTPVKHRMLKTLQQTADQLEAVESELRGHADRERTRLAEVSQRYAIGKAKASDVVDRAAALALAENDATEVRRHATAAVDHLRRQALANARTIGDAWLAPLQARATALIDQANAVADEMGHEPAEPVPGMRRLDSRWSPTRSQLEDDMALRHRWERLGSLLDDLDETHAVADALRNAGLVACVPARDYAEDYRWKAAHRLEGNPAQVREFFLANRHEGEPGLFSATELTDQPLPQVRELGIDTFNQSVLNDQALAAAGSTAGGDRP